MSKNYFIINQKEKIHGIEFLNHNVQINQESFSFNDYDNITKSTKVHDTNDRNFFDEFTLFKLNEDISNQIKEKNIIDHYKKENQSNNILNPMINENKIENDNTNNFLLINKDESKQIKEFNDQNILSTSKPNKRLQNDSNDLDFLSITKDESKQITEFNSTNILSKSKSNKRFWNKKNQSESNNKKIKTQKPKNKKEKKYYQQMSIREYNNKNSNNSIHTKNDNENFNIN